MSSLEAPLTRAIVDTGGNVADLLQCPVCVDLLSAPIQQCRNGHSVCAEHMRRLKECPVCRINYAQGGSSRNILAEALVEAERARQQQVERDLAQQARENALRTDNGRGRTANLPGPSTSESATRNACTGFNPCKYIADGCYFNDEVNSVEQHELTCYYR